VSTDLAPRFEVLRIDEISRSNTDVSSISLNRNGTYTVGSAGNLRACSLVGQIVLIASDSRRIRVD
jgi:hypothetical protein